MPRSLFSQFHEVMTQLKGKSMSKKASNVPNTVHPTGKADPGTEDASTGEWDKETERLLEEAYDATVSNDSKPVEPESEAEGAEIELKPGKLTKEVKMEKDDETDHPADASKANREKSAFIQQVKSASLSELLDYPSKLIEQVREKQAALEAQQLAYALSSIIKSAEDVADVAVEEAKKQTEINESEEKKEEEASEEPEEPEEPKEDSAATAQTEEVVDMVAQILDADPQLADDVVGALVEGGAITEEEAKKILGRELGAGCPKTPPQETKEGFDQAAAEMVMPEMSQEDMTAIMEQGREVLDDLIDSLAQNPEIVVRILAAFVEAGAMTEEDAQEVLDKLGIDTKISEVLKERKAEGSSDEVDQIADQVVGALSGGAGGKVEEASDQLLNQMAGSPPPDLAVPSVEEIIKSSSDDDLSVAAIDAARELGIAFSELSKCGKVGAAIAKQASEFQRSGKYKIRTYKEGSTMRRLIDYMKDYFIELLHKSR